MLLFQLYPKPNIPHFIPLLMPLMVNALTVKAPAEAVQTHKLGNTDLVAAQVKTLSFLTYLLRRYVRRDTPLPFPPHPVYLCTRTSLLSHTNLPFRSPHLQTSPCCIFFPSSLYTHTQTCLSPHLTLPTSY
jgi:hypothetical protein